MRFINTKVHAVLDYFSSLLLIRLSSMLPEEIPHIAALIPTLFAISTVTISLMTDYEASALKAIPMRVHLRIDIASGALLALSPWIFGFHDSAYILHLGFGVFAILVSLFSKTSPTTPNDSNLI